MLIASKENDALLMALAPSIKNYMSEWQIVNVRILEESPLPQEEIIKKLYQSYEKHEGIIYPVSATRIVMIVRFGIISNYIAMKTQIEQVLPKHCCRIALRKMSGMGLKQVQVDLVIKDESIKLSENMYHQRQNRKKNALLIADDDAFMRKSLSKMLALSGEITEAENGSAVMSEYLKCNPDIVFLDIHMPGHTGLELIHKIIEVDQDAFIIILSADSSAENVKKALEEGASGFLSKPPSKQKVQEYINQCITMK